MPKHPKIPNSTDANELIRSASHAWNRAVIRLSWAHERPGTGSLSGATIFEEEILEARVKSCRVKGRRNGAEELRLTLHLELDTDMDFAYGNIAFLAIEKDDGMATLHFRSIPGASQSPEEVRIERVG